MAELTGTARERAAHIAAMCDKAEETSEGWKACCPAHDDHDPSLGIGYANGRVLINCFAKCDYNAVLAALGLDKTDLFGSDMPEPQRHHRDRNHRLDGYAITATYNYVDIDGTLLHQTVRYEHPSKSKQFLQRRPDPANLDGWIWNLRGIRRVLYRLPAVVQAIAEGTIIYLTEGEKDADTLTAHGFIATCNAMGASKWRQDYTEALRGAHVVILQHYDDPGADHTHTLTSHLCPVVATCKVIDTFHTDKSHSDVTDWFAAGGTPEAFVDVVNAAPLYAPQKPTIPLGWPSEQPHTTPITTIPQPRRAINQWRHLLPQVVAQAEDALLHMPGAPMVFQRARRLVSIAPAEPTIPGMTRAQGTPIISALTGHRLRELLARAAAWFVPRIDKNKEDPDMPQPWVVETLLDKEYWTLPPLTGIVHSPTMRPDGQLILTPGYDAHTGLWLAWQGAGFPAVPDNPTRQDAQTALEALKEPLQDFPFAAEHHRIAAIAAILTLVARYAVQSVPLFAIRATTRGSGKTLLADVIAMIASGRMAPKMPQVKEEDEERKRLLALALDGDSLVVIDNVTGALGNPALDLAITSQTYKDRLLGKNATLEAPLHTVFFATGNAMFFKGDMARRALPIDLEPDVENPETRSGFRYPRLLTWIQQERPRLISAALTLLRAYWVAGKPAQHIAPYGSFEAWSDLVRSSLVWAGAEDPCTGREGLEAASDETYENLRELLNAWYECYPGIKAGHSLSQVIADIGHGVASPAFGDRDEEDLRELQAQWVRLREALGAFDPKYDGQRLSTKTLGYEFRRRIGRVIDGKRLKQHTQHTKHGALWQVEIVAGPQTNGPINTTANSLNGTHRTVW